MDINKLENYLDRALKIKYVECIESTNTYLMNDASDLELLIAGNQSAGKGRYQNKYHSYNGGLYFSIKIKLDSLNIETMNIKMALSVFDALKAENIDVEIKWLNDLLYQNKKVCGILCENAYSGSGYQYSVIGVGLNLFKPIEDNEIFNSIATYLFDEQIDVELLVAKILNNFFNYLKDDEYLIKYRNNLKMINKKIKYNEEMYLVLNIAEDGRLKVIDKDKNIILLDNTSQGVKIIHEQ